MAIPNPDTTEWVPIWNPTSTGPVGPQGPQGPQGIQGPQGATGPAGTTVSVRVHNGDLNIPNGSASGISTLPYSVNLAKAYCMPNTTAASGLSEFRFYPTHQTSAGTANQVQASRTSTSGDLNVRYCVVEFL